MRIAYFDNAASTRPAAEVLTAMALAAAELYGNPSAAHSGGAAAARALELARADLADVLGGQPSELVFTGNGTEANALAILGIAANDRRRHLVASAIEHPSVLRNLERLAGRGGFELTVVGPDPLGVIRPDAVVAAVRSDTSLVCVMHVNNEVGTVQPVRDIARALQAHATRIRARRPHFHVDGVQSFGQLSFRVGTLGADSFGISAHKLHGPKGVGALWVRAGARPEPLWDGGRQERGLRSGTENLPGAIGFACAAQLAAQSLGRGRGRATTSVEALRDRFELDVVATVSGARRTLDTAAPRAPHISSILLPNLPAEPLLHALEARGVLASAGSACASRNQTQSHVLQALGVDARAAVLRFSLSRETTADDVRAAVAALGDAIASIQSTAARAG